MHNYSKQNYPLQGETKLIIGFAYDIYHTLGRGFLEIVYKDALEYDLKNSGIFY